MTATFPGSVKSFGADRITGDYIPASDTNDVRAEIVAIETALLGGWLDQTETWTYASASTFTVPGDRTSYYTKGRRIRFTQSATVKYGIVSGSTYGAPNTTVTILVNTSYTIANAVISAPAVSDLDNPQGWPGWFTWAPTWSGSGSMTYGTVTVNTARYQVNGRMVSFVIRANGTTGGTASTDIRATLPVTPVSSVDVPCAVAILDVAYIQGKGAIDTVNGLVKFSRLDAANWALAAGKVVAAEGFYEW